MFSTPKKSSPKQSRRSLMSTHTDLSRLQKIKKSSKKKRNNDPSYSQKGNGNHDPRSLYFSRGADNRETFIGEDNKVNEVKSSFMVNSPVFKNLGSKSEANQLLHMHGKKQKTHTPIREVIKVSENGTPDQVKSGSGAILSRRKGKGGRGSDLVFFSNLPSKELTPIKTIDKHKRKKILSGKVYRNLKPLRNSSITVTAELPKSLYDKNIKKKHEKRISSQSSVIMKKGVDKSEQKGIANRYGKEFDEKLQYEIAHGISYSLLREASQTEENLMITSKHGNSDKIPIETKLNDPKFRKAFGVSVKLNDSELQKEFGENLRLTVTRIPVKGIPGCRLVAEESYLIEHPKFKCNLTFNGQSNVPPHIADFEYTYALVNTLVDLHNGVTVPPDQRYPQGQGESPKYLFSRSITRDEVVDMDESTDDVDNTARVLNF